ncbi:MFS general substrate transporter, partial [Aureobasidium melanogenum]
MWPGMTYYLSLYYPPSRCARRIGHYYTAAQLSAAVVGLVSAGFQKMDGLGGLVGFQWMFLIYGLLAVILGVVLLWWLPDRPHPPGEKIEQPVGWRRALPRSPPVLTGEDARIHYEELTRVYHRPSWGWKDLGRVLIDWRLWPLVIMYFGVVGVGIGVQSYGTVIIHAINPSLSSINLSLLFAPIWIMDLIAIVLITPLSDRFHTHRHLIFCLSCLVILAGLLTTTFAGGNDSWSRYGGLLIIGFGLGPTVPTIMAMSTSVFQPRHGEVGIAAASALVSGLGNLGSIVTT